MLSSGKESLEKVAQQKLGSAAGQVPKAALLPGQPLACLKGGVWGHTFPFG